MYRPANFNNSTESFPVIFYIHGRGGLGSGSSTSLNKLLNEGVAYFIHNNRFPASFTVNGKTSSFVVISPQFAYNPSVNDIKTVIDYFLNGNYKIDPNRIYLTGYSVGGDLAFKYPGSGTTAAQRLAATVPGAAYNNPYDDSGAPYIAASNLPTLAVHSNDDEVIRVGNSQSYIDKINSYQPAVPAKIWRFSGYSHSAAWKVMYDPAWRANGLSIYEWMLQYQRGTTSSNLPPSVNAGSDQTIELPQNSVQLNGSATDPDGSIASYSWTKVSGPSAYTFNNSAIANPVVSNLEAGTYIFRLTAKDNAGATGYNDVMVTVNGAPNQAPVVRAGNDQSITLPVNSITLSGSATDADGTIVTYTWTKQAGPESYTFSNAASASTTVSNLAEGTYTFRLTAKDNSGASAYDEVSVVVNPSSPTTSSKYIQVNVFGGSNAYSNAQWNNWNVGAGTVTNVSSSAFKYTDGTLSVIKATLSQSTGMGDNGTMTAGMAPAEVLRYASYSTVGRTLTISGLSASKRYDIELYAGRNNNAGNQTVFTIGGSKDTINTYNNNSEKALFSNLIPNAQGQIVVHITRLQTWTYLNGFVLAEHEGSTVNSTNFAQRELIAPESSTATTPIAAYPNPVQDRFVLQVNNLYKGVMSISIIDMNGVVRKTFSLTKPSEGVMHTSLSLGDLPQGEYILTVRTNQWVESKRISKK